MLGLIRAVGEVRLAQGLPLLDLRDAVDPPGDPARAGEHRPHRSGCPCTSPSGRARSAATERELTTKLGREPDRRGDRRRRPDLTLEEVTQIRKADRDAVSLDTPVGDDGEHLARRPHPARTPTVHEEDAENARVRRVIARRPAHAAPSVSARSSSCASAPTRSLRRRRRRPASASACRRRPSSNSSSAACVAEPPAGAGGPARGRVGLSSPRFAGDTDSEREKPRGSAPTPGLSRC